MGDIFGNYGNLRINRVSQSIDYIQVPLEIDQKLFLIAQKVAIVFRDEMIIAKLNQSGVVSLLDIGCDFGSLLLEAGKQGIRARGVDVLDSTLALARMADLDVVKYSIEQIVADKSFRSVSLSERRGFSAVSCLNILHGNWEDVGVRDKFLEMCLDSFDYVVITATRELFTHFSKKFNLTYAEFIGPANRPMHKISSQLSQYGTTFYFKGRMHIVECHFWKLIFGSRRYPNPVNNYLNLVIIISSRINPLGGSITK